MTPKGLTMLDQTCPCCQTTEAAGGYCTACERPTLPSWIHPPKRSARQRATAARFVANQCKGSRRAASEAA